MFLGRRFTNAAEYNRSLVGKELLVRTKRHAIIFEMDYCDKGFTKDDIITVTRDSNDDIPDKNKNSAESTGARMVEFKNENGSKATGVAERFVVEEFVLTEF